jgi:hypothetical protein
MKTTIRGGSMLRLGKNEKKCVFQDDVPFSSEVPNSLRY